MPQVQTVGPLVDRLFRREYGRIVARLVHWLGPAQADLAEDAAQEAMASALRSWPWRGVPEQPEAWLGRAARNAAIDRIRKARPGLRESLPEDLSDPDTQFLPEEDAELSLLFLCADPAFPHETSVPLTLKLACGFGDREIASALGIDPATVRQRITRAKRRWGMSDVTTELSSDDLDARAPAVMNVIYLMLNEGYGGQGPEGWQRIELCREAVRLARLLASHRRVDRPDADALAALCLFHLARVPARLDGQGDIIGLADQDRTRWNADLTGAGFRWMRRAERASNLTTYHLLAGIASCHAVAVTYDETDWGQVVRYYDQLVALDPGSPFHRLNRAIAMSENGSATEALALIDMLSDDKRLAAGYMLPAARAWVLQALDRRPEARRALVLAISRAAPSPPIQRRLQSRLAALSAPDRLSGSR